MSAPHFLGPGHGGPPITKIPNRKPGPLVGNVSFAGIGSMHAAYCAALTLLLRLAIRLILRAAGFLWMTPLLFAESMAATAARIMASLSAALLSMAASAFLITVFRLVLMALLCIASFLACTTRSFWDLMLGIRSTSLVDP